MQFNNNLIEDWHEVDVLKEFPQLDTVYLEGNPISMDPNYRRKIMLISPSVNQIDATLCRQKAL